LTRPGKFLLVTLLNVLIALVMYHYYTLSGSSALFAEFVHNACDSLCLAVAALASVVSTIEPKRGSYRYTRAETLTALLNSAIVAFAALTILSHIRIGIVAGNYMVIAASIAVPANLAGYAFLRRDESLNARAVRLHLMIDCLFSAAVAFAGLAVSEGWYWMDVAVAGVIAVHMLIHSLKIAKRSISILMQLPPENVDVEEITREIGEVPGVRDVHHVHVWQLDEFGVHFECHLKLDCELRLREADEVRKSVESLLKRKGINHTTIQVECSCDGFCSFSRALQVPFRQCRSQ